MAANPSSADAVRKHNVYPCLSSDRSRWVVVVVSHRRETSSSKLRGSKEEPNVSFIDNRILTLLKNEATSKRTLERNVLTRQVYSNWLTISDSEEELNHLETDFKHLKRLLNIWKKCIYINLIEKNTDVMIQAEKFDKL